MTPTMPTVLYIDDDEALARLVDRGLTRLGLRVVHAASGQHGLDRLAQGGIDVIALDQYRRILAARLRAQRPLSRHRRIPPSPLPR